MEPSDFQEVLSQWSLDFGGTTGRMPQDRTKRIESFLALFADLETHGVPYDELKAFVKTRQKTIVGYGYNENHRHMQKRHIWERLANEDFIKAVVIKFPLKRTVLNEKDITVTPHEYVLQEKLEFVQSGLREQIKETEEVNKNELPAPQERIFKDIMDILEEDDNE